MSAPCDPRYRRRPLPRTKQFSMRHMATPTSVFCLPQSKSQDTRHPPHISSQQTNMLPLRVPRSVITGAVVCPNMTRRQQKQMAEDRMYLLIEQAQKSHMFPVYFAGLDSMYATILGSAIILCTRDDRSGLSSTALGGIPSKAPVLIQFKRATIAMSPMESCDKQKPVEFFQG